MPQWQMHPVQNLTLTLPPALEVPSLWCGNHTLSHHCRAQQRRPPSPALPLFAIQAELSQGGGWRDLPLLLLDFCWGVDAGGMWGNSSEGPTFATCPVLGCFISDYLVIYYFPSPSPSKCKQQGTESCFPGVISKMGRAREVVSLVSDSFKGK